MIYLYISTALMAVALLWLAFQVRHMTTRSVALNKRTINLEKELQAAAIINQTLGNRLLATEAESKRLDAQLAELQEFGKNDLFQQRTFKQAGKMAQLGASVDELKRSCELSQGEAELLRHMHQIEEETRNGVH